MILTHHTSGSTQIAKQFSKNRVGKMVGPPKLRHKGEQARATASAPDSASAAIAHAEPDVAKDALKGEAADDPTLAHDAASANSSIFPQKLMKIMSADDITGIIEWCLNGEAIIIKDRARLSNEVLPRYFGEAEYRSFTRRLLRWGFKRIAKGKETGAFYHELFRRDKPELCSRIITCQKIKTADRRTKRGLSVDEASSKISAVCNRSSKKRRKDETTKSSRADSSCRTPNDAKPKSFETSPSHVITHSGGDRGESAAPYNVLNRFRASGEPAQATDASSQHSAPDVSPFLPSMRGPAFERLVRAEIMQRESILNARAQADLLHSSLREADRPSDLLSLRLAASRNAEAAAAAGSAAYNYPPTSPGFNRASFSPDVLAIAQARAAAIRNATSSSSSYQQADARQALYESVVTNMQQRLDMERLALLRRAQLEVNPSHQLAVAMAAKEAQSVARHNPAAYADPAMSFATGTARHQESKDSALGQRLRILQAQLQNKDSPTSIGSAEDRKLPPR